MEIAGNIRNDANVDFSNAFTDLLDDVRLSGTGRITDPFFIATGSRLTNEAGHTIEFTDASMLDLTDLDMPEIINFGTIVLSGDVEINEVIETQVLPAGSTVPDLSDPENDPDAVTVLTEDTPYDVLRVFKNYGTLETPGALSVTDNAIQNEGLVRANGINLFNAEILGSETSSVDLGGNTLEMNGLSVLSGGSILNATVRVSGSVETEPASITTVDLSGSGIDARSYVELGGSVDGIGALRVDSAVGDVPMVLIGNADTTVNVGATIINAGKIELSAGALITDTAAFDPGATQTTPGLDWTGGTLRLEQQAFETMPGGVFGDRVDLLSGMTLEAPQGVRVAASSTLGIGGGSLNSPSLENNGRVEVGVGDADGSVDAPISGTGMARKIGGGTFGLTGVNSYLGDTEILAGTLEAQTSESLGDPASTIHLRGGNLRITGPDTGATPRALVFGTGAATMDVADPAGVFEVSSASLNVVPFALTKNGRGTLNYDAVLGLGAGQLNVNDGRLDVLGHAINLDGTDGSEGNTGNTAGDVDVAGELATPLLFARGGEGGDGADGTSTTFASSDNNGQPGATGGRGGLLTINDGQAQVTNQIDLTGGRGGRGGDGASASFSANDGDGGDGGRGGNGGNIFLNGGELLFTSGSINLAGGAGGFGGDGADFGEPSGQTGQPGFDGRLRLSGGTLTTNRSQLDFSLNGNFQFSTGVVRLTDPVFDIDDSTRLNTALGTSSKIIRNGRGLHIDNTLQILAGQSLTLTNGGSLTADTLDHTHGGDFSFFGGTLSVGTFDGDLNQDGGTLTPGASPGTTTVTGDYTLSDSTIEIELAGLIPGLEHDQVNVAEDLTLTNVALEVVLLESFELGANQTFDILTIGGGRTGAFVGLGEGDLAGTFRSMDLFITYKAGGGNSIALYTVPEPSTIAVLGLGVLLIARRRR
jgi:autotransporter-associated beta strand protein